MINVSEFVARADALAAKTERSRATVSKWLFNNDAGVLDRLASGQGSVTIDTFNKALAELARREALLRGDPDPVSGLMHRTRSEPA